MMMKKYSMRAIPAAAAMVAALVFGVQANAQTNTGNPPGSTNPKDSSSSTGPAARVAAPGVNGSDPITPGTTGIAGTTKAKDVVIPKGTTAKTAEERSAAKADRASARAAKRAARASKKSTAIDTRAQTPGGDMSSTATSTSK
jgi:hypothetical protein